MNKLYICSPEGLEEVETDDTERFKEKLIDFLVKHEICECCNRSCTFDSNDEEKCKEGIKTWVDFVMTE
ncbi:hypothetical protein [Clostridioides difficile]|uniref:hypothetical protein n=1 Tax=Clostridioides difficile TaxID=1496 RepID=UPI00255161B6|nr:hypothetical protein [Clostridioides difficile]MDL0163653.1 hypothetical protein [Clostridioides difficile]